MHVRRAILTAIALAWCSCCAGLYVRAATAADNENAPDKTPLQKAIDASLGWFEFTVPEQNSTLQVVAVLRWDNQTRGSQTGLTALFVPHKGGRPEAVVCAYPWEGRLTHEFSSLSRRRFSATLHGEAFWAPERAGLDFAKIPDADPPAASAVARLRQMKSHAERFEATLLGWRADRTDRQELRRLPRPLYRYDKAGGDVVDGAVFAFVMGTDPEVLLLIEAVRADDDKLRWEYAFVRRTSGYLAGRLDGETVWEAPGFPSGRDPRGLNRSSITPLDELRLDEQSPAAKP
ncbi:MAG: hypothetical protein KY476_18685 [Planctomycetes bacterium]|nr:hypothetical protein [Planctomycetota bacterium]